MLFKSLKYSCKWKKPPNTLHYIRKIVKLSGTNAYAMIKCVYLILSLKHSNLDKLQKCLYKTSHTNKLTIFRSECSGIFLFWYSEVFYFQAWLCQQPIHKLKLYVVMPGPCPLQLVDCLHQVVGLSQVLSNRWSAKVRKRQSNGLQTILNEISQS